MDNYENDNLEPKTSFDENQETTNNNNLNDEKIQSGQLYFSLDEKKTNIIYDISNFSMIFLFICCIGYCMFVPFANYNWIILFSTLCCALIFFALAHTTQIIATETKFSKVSNYLIENINYGNTYIFIKNATKLILKGLKYLIGIYPIMYLLCAFVIPHDFVLKYYPYCFHSNCSWLGSVVFSIFCMVILFCLFKFKIKYIGEILGAVLLYTLFDEQLYDSVVKICETIGAAIMIITFVIVVLFVAVILFVFVIIPAAEAHGRSLKRAEERQAEEARRKFYEKYSK